MKKYKDTRVVFPYEGGIDIWEIEEILKDKPKTRNQPGPTQIEPSQLVKAIKATE